MSTDHDRPDVGAEPTQNQITAEIAAAHAAAAAAGPLPAHPLRDFGPYRSSLLRNPTH